MQKESSRTVTLKIL